MKYLVYKNKNKLPDCRDSFIIKRRPGWGKRSDSFTVETRRPGWGKRTPGWGKRSGQSICMDLSLEIRQLSQILAEVINRCCINIDVIKIIKINKNEIFSIQKQKQITRLSG
jgi:hypothetical protein